MNLNDTKNVLADRYFRVEERRWVNFHVIVLDLIYVHCNVSYVSIVPESAQHHPVSGRRVGPPFPPLARGTLQSRAWPGPHSPSPGSLGPAAAWIQAQQWLHTTQHTHLTLAHSKQQQGLKTLHNFTFETHYAF